MEMFITSDHHFNHDKDFIWGKRGFKNVYEMNEALIQNWNEVVGPDDIVVHLGDLFLGHIENINSILYRLHGEIHLIIGNHDTKTRIDHYRASDKVKQIKEHFTLEVEDCELYLDHRPIDASLMRRYPKQEIYCVHGHVHTTEKFLVDFPCCYNATVDANDLKPVHVDTILASLREHYHK